MLFVVLPSLNNLIKSMLVMTDIICSDHRPLSVTFVDVISQLNTMLTSNPTQNARYDWSIANSIDINMYQRLIDWLIDYLAIWIHAVHIFSRVLVSKTTSMASWKCTRWPCVVCRRSFGHSKWHLMSYAASDLISGLSGGWSVNVQ